VPAGRYKRAEADQLTPNIAVALAYPPLLEET
jgi:hypothetical protein